GTSAHGALELADLRLELLVPRGQAETALADDLEVAGLDLEHVEVLQEAPAAVETAAGLGDPGEVAAGPQLLSVHHLAVEVAEDEGVVLGTRGHEGGADTGLGRGDRVVHLVLPVDREQARVLSEDPHDLAAGRARDLVVRVRESPGATLDGPCLAQLGNAT